MVRKKCEARDEEKENNLCIRGEHNYESIINTTKSLESIKFGERWKKEETTIDCRIFHVRLLRTPVC